MNQQSIIVFGLLSAALVWPGCIRREPKPLAPTATAASASVVSEKTEAGAPSQPTGNYGKVPGVDLLAKSGITAFLPHGETGRVEVRKIPVIDQPFTEALELKVKEDSANFWDVQVQAPSADAVERGDILLASFYLRTEWTPDEGAEGQTEFVFELARPPWDKSASYPVRAGREWKKVTVPFEATQSFRVGEAQMIFRLGYPKQTIQIAEVKVENFGKQLSLLDLPVTTVSYAGSEPTAAWRKAAEERIEKHRKAEFELVVKDAAGQRIAGAEIEVKQVRQAFAFGTAVEARRLLSSTDTEYQRVLSELFNTATLEHELTWPALAGDLGAGTSREQAKRAIDWLRERGLGVRGRALLAPGWQHLPRGLRSLEKEPARLRTEVERHLRELGTLLSGKVLSWDVVHEPYDHRALFTLFGESVAVDWFKAMRAVDPNAELLVNDYGLLSGGGGNTAHRDTTERFLRMLLDAGAPLDAIGMQGRFASTLTPPKELLQLLDRFAKLERPLVVTEYEILLADERLAADYTRDFYTTLFSHPKVRGIVMAGFWDGAHARNNAPMYRKDWSLKPAGEELRRLLLQSFRTQVTGKTDSTGTYRVRGFLGGYAIKVRHGAELRELQVDLAEAGHKSEIVL